MKQIEKYVPFIDQCLGKGSYTMEDIRGGSSYDIKKKLTCGDAAYIVKVVEGALEKTEPDRDRLLWYQALCRIHRQNPGILGPTWYSSVNNHAVTITEWVDGAQLNDLFDRHPDLMPVYGREVGKLLYQLHHVDFVKAAVEERNVSVRAKVFDTVSRLKATIKENGIHFDGMDAAIAFLDENADAISDDRVGMVQNDVRPENVILKDETLYLFDFDSGTIGDVYSDFTYLTAMSHHKYRPFSAAVIESYFDGDVPEVFWKVNACFCIIKLLEYAIYRYEKSGRMIAVQAENYMNLFDNYTNPIPRWIREIAD